MVNHLKELCRCTGVVGVRLDRELWLMQEFLCIPIRSHFHKTAYMHEQTIIGIHKEEVPKLVYTLSGVSQ